VVKAEGDVFIVTPVYKEGRLMMDGDGERNKPWNSS
jgi:hypothetical protein